MFDTQIITPVLFDYIECVAIRTSSEDTIAGQKMQIESPKVLE
jgi:hypothetical protein